MSVHDRPREHDGTCHIWWADVQGTARSQRHLLSRAEQERADTLRQTDDQDRFVAGRALLRTLAADLLGTTANRVVVGSSCPDCPRPHGKPTLPGTEWQASISHSGRLVAVALSTAGPVGIDLERIDETIPLFELWPHILSAAESVACPHDTPHSFFRTWTRKEAVLKATGDGLRISMPRISVTPADAIPAVTSFLDRPELVDRIRLADLEPAPGYSASVAVISSASVDYTDHGITRFGRVLSGAGAR
ncbi:4'-phosphopantetheinyl transferase superfamily protein [Streptomyces sp. NBC_01799]|uniref:4'-phosphopantetheinyl transferase family protein n=1 Tax=Streptomyces sp. NBC_01800 TaxID=2975945 RepID=UPI002DD98849|nr:4'-phosphopantetheinyl transferase superfamily protein [Streptomyces sp. NBC_01800]WSA71467.1 4'-phosphopantetheinyl transferase superfamily protein [Streptomyces sp. NBC_01800]WSA79979.1 4'-phosphopantetheinyl transferase superfamily protein [Streptomyces sp. NBC_01799]